MQAYGRYDFTATADDELSFQKGAVIKVNFTSNEQIQIIYMYFHIGTQHRRRYELV